MQMGQIGVYFKSLERVTALMTTELKMPKSILNVSVAGHDVALTELSYGNHKYGISVSSTHIASGNNKRHLSRALRELAKVPELQQDQFLTGDLIEKMRNIVDDLEAIYRLEGGE